MQPEWRSLFQFSYVAIRDILVPNRHSCSLAFACSLTVARLVGKGSTYEMDLVVDVQSELFAMKRGESMTLALASTLDMQGRPDDGVFNQSGDVSSVGCCARHLSLRLAHLFYTCSLCYFPHQLHQLPQTN
jgi:hypothetical protein